MTEEYALNNCFCGCVTMVRVAPDTSMRLLRGIPFHVRKTDAGLRVEFETNIAPMGITLDQLAYAHERGGIVAIRH